MREEYIAKPNVAKKQHSATDGSMSNSLLSSSCIDNQVNPVLPDDQLPVKTGLLPGYRPTEAELLRYHHKWDTLQVYVAHEEALNMLFQGLDEFKANTSLRHVIIKCAVLNDFYSTNIYQVEPVAQKIIAIRNFDNRVQQGDPSLVHEIAEIENFPRIYSFATKYCAHHNPDDYAIYDRYVADVLMFLKKQTSGIMPFKKREELKDYMVFKKAIETVRDEFGLGKYSLKDIDRYLWQLGKDYYNPYVKQKI